MAGGAAWFVRLREWLGVKGRVHALIAAVFMLSLSGQDCTGCNNPPPPSCLGCTGNQIVVCDVRCGTPRNLGDTCNPENPCEVTEDGTAFGQCASGAVCSALLGRCIADQVAQPCDPSQAGICGDTEYCRPASCAGPQGPRCSLPNQAGLACNPGDQCTPCAPGLTCALPMNPSNPLSGIEGTCVLGPGLCTSDAQCNSCAGATCLALDDVTQPTPGIASEAPGVLFGSATGHCYTCVQGLGTGCSAQTPCCTPGYECEKTALPGEGTCCIATTGVACKPGDCCNGLVCRAVSAGASSTCEGCGQTEAFCQAGSDCCSGRCIGNTCREACPDKGESCKTTADCCTGLDCNTITGECEYPVAHTCKTDSDCAGAGVTCTCGVCVDLNAEKPGDSCVQFGKQGTCVCQAADGKSPAPEPTPPEQTQCIPAGTPGTGTCCLGTCSLCQGNSECCGNAEKLVVCEQLGDTASTSRCCGIQSPNGPQFGGAPCTQDSDCCSDYTCVNGKCKTCATKGCNQTIACSAGGGCVALGNGCSKSGAACCGSAQCVNGTCQAATSRSYDLLSYAFSDYTSTAIPSQPTFQAAITSGTPVALPAYTPVGGVKDEVVATNTPGQLVAFKYAANPMSVSQDFAVGIEAPFNLMDIVPPGTAEQASTFDAVAGQSGAATYYQIVNKAINQQNVATVNGNAVAVSASTNFDYTSQKDVTIGTDYAGGKLYHFEFADTPPLQEGFFDLGNAGLGTPISVDTASMDTWVVTQSPNTFIRFGVPALGIEHQASLDPSLGTPVAVSGAKTLAQGYPYIVVLFAPNGSGPGQVLAYDSGNVLDPLPITNSFIGTPVGMAVTANGSAQFAWIATHAPDQILLFNVSISASPVTTISLPGTPIAVTVGLNSTSSTSGDKTGMLHVVVAEP